MGSGKHRGRGGGRGGGRGRGGRGRGGGGRGPPREDTRVSYDKIDKNNEKLENYYNEILGLDDQEKEHFWAALRRELPNSFRFTGSRGHALAVQKLLKTRYIPEITSIKHNDDSTVPPPIPVPWYPDELAWWMTTPKNIIRRFPPFASFQKFLVSETTVGNISRQEVVSMIPPLVIDIEPGMVVLDMCAAPGSKAAQLLEAVHAGEEARVRKALRMHAKEDGREVSPGPATEQDFDEKDMGDFGRTTGLLIANDSDYKRSHMLVHQLKRLSSPNLIVTNHDATMYPSIKLPRTEPGQPRYLKFDRILADVPCSGDGTIRKNPTLWKDWSPANAMGLYVTQVRILVRALQMLKVGGRVVYSTCSMNPVENEAVIASAIDRCGGLSKVQLLETKDRLPLLKRKPGFRDWTIMDKTGKFWKSWKEVEDHIAENGEDHAPARVVEGMFPPQPEDGEQIPLERCMRIYSHQQDTGGFFIAVLEKMSEIRARPEGESKKTAPKPPITAIVEEIERQPAPKEGENVAPKIEAADVLTGLEAHLDSNMPDSEVPADSNGVAGTKRPADEEVEIPAATKKLKIKDEPDLIDENVDDAAGIRQPPPGAQLDLTVRPGDMHSDSKADPIKNKNRNGQQFEEPYKYIATDHPEVQSIEKFYSISPRFPRDRFMVRNASGEPVKTLYYTSALARDILTENEGSGMKFVHSGVKMFMKQDVQSEDICRWRIQSEGMPILEGYVGEERVVRLYKRETLRKLLIEMFPKVTDGGWENLGEIGERVRDIGMGCCVLRVEPSDDEDGFEERMVLPLWRSLHSLNLMLAKEDRSAMLLRLFNDTTPLVNNQNGANDKRDAKEVAELAEAAELPEAGDLADASVAPGFKMEDGEVKVDTSMAIESAATAEDRDMTAAVKEGPYGEIVAAVDEVGFAGKDVRAVALDKGEEPKPADDPAANVEGTLGNSI